MAKCKINNCWMSSIESAGIGIASPKGGHLFIRKLDVDLLSDEQWSVIEPLTQYSEREIELSSEQMSRLLEACKVSGGIISIGKRVSRLENVAAPQNNKVPQQKSYMQRNAERLKRIANTNQSTLHGQCPNCSQRGMKVKHHGTWAGYYCSACSKGGSITLKK